MIHKYIIKDLFGLDLIFPKEVFVLSAIGLQRLKLFNRPVF